ncbi:MAG: glutamine--fructose-6-phosphate transaminase (isomerizing) [Methylomonas sp.]
MCGIIGAIGQGDVVPFLLEGLKRSEYRGYDSAGLAVVEHGELQRQRQVGKVCGLEALLKIYPLQGKLGIAHTRWATHGRPSTNNAHPHISCDKVAVVHNGIIENHEALRTAQIRRGYQFTSETDTEVIVHQLHEELQTSPNLVEALQATVKKLHGAYALGVISRDDPDTLVVCRKGSPLVIGVGNGEYFIASDVAALLPVTQHFIFLEDNDIAAITKDNLLIYDGQGQIVSRPIKHSRLKADSVSKGDFPHYMLKEIYEQPQAVQSTLAGRFIQHQLQATSFGHQAEEVFKQIQSVQIIACGTSYHAGLIASYWLEKIAKIPCRIEVASEFRYRQPMIHPDTLIVTISQSGETADTLAALQEAKKLGAKYALAICNVPESSIVRESDLVLLTHAGPEIGVASTKAFTTQLVGLMMLVLALGKHFGLNQETEQQLTDELFTLPSKIDQVLLLARQIETIAQSLTSAQHALFLGRGTQYPVAMEGALKLKEISYIHAEAYPAGELKHGPLALIDANMPVIAIVPNNSLLEKLKSNLHEVSARGGKLIVFIDEQLAMSAADNVEIIKVPRVGNAVAPIIYSIPLQLLAYYVATLKGTNVDQPRNLAKSVTVE